MIDTIQSNRPLWHQNLAYGQVEAEAEKDCAKVVYNLHEDCLCLREELAALKQSIPKIRADAIRDAIIDAGSFYCNDIDHTLTRVDDLIEYAKKIEDQS